MYIVAPWLQGKMTDRSMQKQVHDYFMFSFNQSNLGLGVLKGLTFKALSLLNMFL